MNMRFGVKQRIFLGFFIVIFIFMISAVVSVFTLNKNSHIVSEVSEVIDPSLQSINDFNLLITESKMWSTNWVYLQSNQEDKDSLKQLIEKKYPKLKAKINKQKEQWIDKKLSKAMDSVFISFEQLIQKERNITELLVSFESYEDPMVKIEAEGIIEIEILPHSKLLMDQLRGILQLKQKEKAIYQQDIVASSDNLRLTIILLAAILIVIGVTVSIFMANSIIKPLDSIKKIINNLGKGELNELNIEIKNDEIGEMAASVQSLTEGLRNTAKFSSNIGDGVFDASYEPLSENDVLGKSLIEMRDNLKRVSEEAKQRNWSSEGLAKFADILRANDQDKDNLAANIISNLIKYLNANQGGIFLINDDNMDDIYLELSACYAYERKKFLEKRVEMGEGLIGQCVLEKDTIYITDVPTDYIQITSGLGDAPPRCILIVPLKINQDIFGVIELATFEPFRPFEVEFVQKMAESIASTMSSAKVNERTRKLLEQSQTQAEQLRSQEEEMRQNMEELMATQEQMTRSKEEETNS
jgi:HAMP domain-containing protein/putative methionine-R-sulfoxide reductase with GAF domain